MYVHTYMYALICLLYFKINSIFIIVIFNIYINSDNNIFDFPFLFSKFLVIYRVEYYKIVIIKWNIMENLYLYFSRN